jgi:hypothetical protein
MRINREEYRQTIQRALEPHRFEILAKKSEWIHKSEPRLSGSFASGAEIDPHAVRPSLELVTTGKQHELWRYCRLMGSIPFNRGCGRLIRYLLRDEGHERRPIMGVIALSSPVLINKPRDEWIGWEYPRDVDIKRRKILACMELSVSMAVPPYNHLTAGKMICLSVLSNEVRRDYLDKFGEHVTPTGLVEGRLGLITTTSLYGSSIQYNRIKVDGRTAYRLIGYTSGFGNAYVTEKQFAEMETYLKENGKEIPKGWGTGRSYRLRVYTAYSRLRDGAPMAPSHQHPRSIYVAPLASNSKDFLCGRSEELNYYDLSYSRLVQIWRERWVVPRLARPDVIQRFRSADVPLLSDQLEAYKRTAYNAAAA